VEWLKKAQSLYRRSERALIYLDLVFVVVVFYAGKYLGPLRDQLLPVAIAGGFAILLEALFSMSDSLQEKVGAMEYHTIGDSLPKMLGLVKQENDRRHTIRIIASTGGTTINESIPKLAKVAKGPLDVALLLIDPDSSPH
jgi:hypothetical protein